MSDKLENPYKDVPAEKQTCTSITVSNSDRAALMAVYPAASVLQLTLNHLLVKCVAAMRSKGLTEYNPEGFVEFINHLELRYPEPQEAHAESVVAKANKQKKAA